MIRGMHAMFYSSQAAELRAFFRDKLGWKAADVGDGSTARVLETLRDDPDFHHLERIVAEPPLGIETEEAAASELAASLEHLGKDAARAADAQRIRGHRPGTGPA